MLEKLISKIIFDFLAGLIVELLLKFVLSFFTKESKTNAISFA